MKRILLFLAILACHPATTILAEDFTENLIARWTFNKPGDEGLIDDIKKMPIEMHALPGASSELQHNGDGTITVGPEQYLVAPDLNSDTFPELRKGVTIWVRMRIDKADSQHTSFLYGLFTKPRGDWGDAALTINLRPQGMEGPGMQLFGRFDGDKEIGQGDKLFPDHLGEFFTSTLTFDGAKQGVTLKVNEQELTNKKGGAIELVPFTNLSLGRVNLGGGGVTVTFDEVRVYSLPVGSEWVDEIKPVKP